MFFPEIDEDGFEALPCDEARAICAACPKRTACLDYAIRTRQEYGVFGGMNFRERESFKMSAYRHTKRSDFQTAVGEVVGSL